MCCWSHVCSDGRSGSVASKDFLCTERACRAELGFTAGLEIQGDPVTITVLEQMKLFVSMLKPIPLIEKRVKFLQDSKDKIR
jgi:hypothetical protein